MTVGWWVGAGGACDGRSWGEKQKPPRSAETWARQHRGEPHACSQSPNSSKSP